MSPRVGAGAFDPLLSTLRQKTSPPIMLPAEPPYEPSGVFEATKEEQVELPDGTEATLTYMEPKEGELINQGMRPSKPMQALPLTLRSIPPVNVPQPYCNRTSTRWYAADNPDAKSLIKHLQNNVIIGYASTG